MTLSEKSAYLKGLMDGLKLDTEKDEGKMIAAIVDMLSDVAETVADLEDVVDTISDELDEVRRLNAEDVALVAQQLADRVLLDETEGAVERVLADGDHVVGFEVHEVIQIAVVVAVLIVLALDERFFKLCRGVKRRFSHGTGHDVLHLGAHKCRALAGLDVLELDDLHDLAVHLKSLTVSEITSGNGCHILFPPIYLSLNYIRNSLYDFTTSDRIFQAAITK